MVRIGGRPKPLPRFLAHESPALGNVLGLRSRSNSAQSTISGNTSAHLLSSCQIPSVRLRKFGCDAHTEKVFREWLRSAMDRPTLSSFQTTRGHPERTTQRFRKAPVEFCSGLYATLCLSVMNPDHILRQVSGSI